MIYGCVNHCPSAAATPLTRSITTSTPQRRRHRLAVPARGRLRVDPAEYLRNHGILQWFDYHPAERVATFQAIEAAIFVSAAALLLALTLAWVRWRTS